MNDWPITIRETPRRELHDLTARTLTVRAESINEEARSVEAVLATEAPTTVYDFRSWRLIDEVLRVEGAQLPAQVVMLESHMRYGLDTVLGSVRGMKKESGEVVGRLFFAEGDEAAERAWQKVKQGHLTDVSVGYRAIEYTDIKPNTSAVVNGKRYTAGERTLRITTKWRIREGSLVPIGADEGAKIREEHCGTQHRETKMNEELRKYLESLGLRTSASEDSAWAFFGMLDGDRRAEAETLRDGKPEQKSEDPSKPEPAEPQRQQPEHKPEAPTPQLSTVDTEAVRADAIRAERKRVTEIRKLAGEDISEELVQRAIDEGWDTGRASEAFLKAMRDGRDAPVDGDVPAIHSRDHERDCNVRTLAAGVQMRADVDLIEPGASDAQRAAMANLMEQGQRYADMSMLDVCRECIRLDGGRLPHTRIDQVRAAVSGATLASVFTTAVQARMLRSYVEYPDSTDWAGSEDVMDFKTNERMQLGKTAGLQKLARGDTAKHATIGDNKEEYKVARYAKQFVADEMDIIDDRFNVIRQTPAEMGAAARRLRPDLVYSILLANAALGNDSIALFQAATHANYGTTGTTLAAATLQAGIAAMAKQTQDGVNLNLNPRWLIVPQDLRFTARILLKSAERIIASASGGTLNPLLQEDIEIRMDNRIGAAGVTDPATGTAYTGGAAYWYLAASTTQAPTIIVGYLRGTGRTPVLRSFPLTQGQWGIGWDIKMDIGAKALDYRGLYFATGAS
ncbi:MAG: hypothetical protein JSU68_01425 [Phycisphaerales bacterium]|nr:MAG: hypothetical protein JSU68_01425 [Phycisphaerales bacterium]